MYLIDNHLKIVEEKKQNIFELQNNVAQTRKQKNFIFRKMEIKW